MHEFDRDTDTTPIAHGGAGASTRWQAQLSDQWAIVGGRPNGGYLLATAVRAIGRAVAEHADHPHPLTVTAHYLRPGEQGPADVDVELIRTGRTLSTASASLMQSGKERLRLVATFGDLARAAGPTAVNGEPPELTPLEQCPPRGQQPDHPMTLVDRIDTRLDPRSGWPFGESAGVARVQAWLRFADGREPDVWALPFFADALPPAVWAVLHERVWVPTVELTVHVRAVPAPGWLRVVHATRFLVDGFFEEDGEVWDSQGRLVALSRQFAMVSRP